MTNLKRLAYLSNTLILILQPLLQDDFVHFFGFTLPADKLHKHTSKVTWSLHNLPEIDH